MAKVFRPSTRESSILSKIESSKEYERRRQINATRDCLELLANAIAMKLVEEKLVETTNKNSLEEQVTKSIEKLGRADDFEIDYQVAPVRNLVSTPNIVSLYLTAFVIEQMINHKDVVDIFGSDEDIYFCINRQVNKFIPS
jgi:VIT1/CCC1 family predicted Fe2+/Mn2+ transporter